DAAAGQQAGNDGERDGPRCDSTEGEHVFGEGAPALQRPVLAVAEECGVSVATRESLTDQVELDPPGIFPRYKVPGQGRPVRGGIHRVCQLLEHVSSDFPVDGTPIVGIDQAEIPELAALVEVGYPGRRDLDEGLGKRVEGAIVRNSSLKRDEVL